MRAAARVFNSAANRAASGASDPLASAIDFPLSEAILHVEKKKKSPARRVLHVDLIPAMYLVLLGPGPGPRLEQARGSICSNVLTTVMNFSSAAQGDGLPSGLG